MSLQQYKPYELILAEVMIYGGVNRKQWWEEIIQDVTGIKYQTWCKERGPTAHMHFEQGDYLTQALAIVTLCTKYPKKAYQRIAAMSANDFLDKVLEAFNAVLIPLIAKEMNETLLSQFGIGSIDSDTEHFNYFQWMDMICPRNTFTISVSTKFKEQLMTKIYLLFDKYGAENIDKEHKKLVAKYDEPQDCKAYSTSAFYDLLKNRRKSGMHLLYLMDPDEFVNLYHAFFFRKYFSDLFFYVDEEFVKNHGDKVKKNPNYEFDTKYDDETKALFPVTTVEPRSMRLKRNRTPCHEVCNRAKWNCLVPVVCHVCNNMFYCSK